MYRIKLFVEINFYVIIYFWLIGKILKQPNPKKKGGDKK